MGRTWGPTRDVSPGDLGDGCESGGGCDTAVGAATSRGSPPRGGILTERENYALSR